MKDFLFKRVSKPIPKGLNITNGSVPIPYFGNYEKATSCTISINPSDSEFIKKKKGIFDGYRKRLVSRYHLNLNDEDEISKADCKKILESCSNYFSVDPYKSWFNKYDEFLKRFDLSYYNDSVVHLDIVQWATSPIWRNLKTSVKNKLIADDLPFLKHVLQNKKFKYIFLNGRTTVESTKKLLSIDFESEKTILLKGKNYQIYKGKYLDSKVIGWSCYLQSSQVASYEKTRELADIIKRKLNT